MWGFTRLKTGVGASVQGPTTHLSFLHCWHKRAKGRTPDAQLLCFGGKQKGVFHGSPDPTAWGHAALTPRCWSPALGLRKVIETCSCEPEWLFPFSLRAIAYTVSFVVINPTEF